MPADLRLIEPQAFLTGSAAAAAIAAGHAFPLAGSGAAFALARLLDVDRLVAAAEIPPEYHAARDAIARPPTAWAGMTGMPPWIMGIVNVTPDSFSDGGRLVTMDTAIGAGLAMHDAGAGIVDVGGESTRPNAPPTPPDVERARVLPVIRALADAGALVSVDTRNAETMRAALDAGARIVNDVSGLAHDPEAGAVVAQARCPLILMHMRGTPVTMMGLAGYGDVAADVTRELAARAELAEAAGIARACIALDPGIGFAKGAAANIDMLSRLGVLLNLGYPIVVGSSRKAFIGRLGGGAEPAARDPGSIAAALFAALHGASILRVHNVADTVQAVRVWRGLARSG
jgi:dihydropteroate synthase